MHTTVSDFASHLQFYLNRHAVKNISFNMFPFLPLVYTSNLCPDLTKDIEGANSALYEDPIPYSEWVSTVYPSSNEPPDSIMPKDYEFCGCLSLDMFQKYGSQRVEQAPGEPFFAQYK